MRKRSYIDGQSEILNALGNDCAQVLAAIQWCLDGLIVSAIKSNISTVMKPQTLAKMCTGGSQQSHT